jgi:hypothetical protein
LISIGICARNHFPFLFLGWLSDVVVAGHVSLFFVDQQKTTKRHYSVEVRVGNRWRSERHRHKKTQQTINKEKNKAGYYFTTDNYQPHH